MRERERGKGDGRMGGRIEGSSPKEEKRPRKEERCMYYHIVQV
jgi:hypothetical protein